jgi:hypothetical protein
MDDMLSFCLLGKDFAYILTLSRMLEDGYYIVPVADRTTYVTPPLQESEGKSGGPIR